MLRYIPILAVVGLIFCIVFAVADKFLAKIADAKKRKYLRIALYAVLYLCIGCITVAVIDFYK